MRESTAALRLPRLVGERASVVKDPRRNTAMQRTWMYADDPALMYVLRGPSDDQEKTRATTGQFFCRKKRIRGDSGRGGGRTVSRCDYLACQTEIRVVEKRTFSLLKRFDEVMFRKAIV